MDGRQAPARRRGSARQVISRQEVSGPAGPNGRKRQMARITLRQLLDHAAENDYGVPAFNINNMEQALAIMDAASAVDAPVIIQASRGARAYANDVMLRYVTPLSLATLSHT